jgi:hypothetical protein
LRILSAIDIKILRTNVHHGEVSNLLKAIRVLKKEDPNFKCDARGLDDCKKCLDRTFSYP